jgi:hypothetical protein
MRTAHADAKSKLDRLARKRIEPCSSRGARRARPRLGRWRRARKSINPVCCGAQKMGGPQFLRASAASPPTSIADSSYWKDEIFRSGPGWHKA